MELFGIAIRAVAALIWTRWRARKRAYGRHARRRRTRKDDNDDDDDEG